MIKAEFHVHTRYSNDSILNKYFILFMCKLKKIKLLAITDHNEIQGALKYKDFFCKHKIEVIVGEEIMTECGEIIGLYLNKKIEANLSVGETIRQIKEQNGLIYLPHPYDEKRYKTVLDEKQQLRYKEYFDFVEIHNGRNVSEKFDRQQEKIQKKLEVIGIVGSDAHTFFELGRNYMLINYNGKEGLSESIKNGKMINSRCIKVAHRVTKIARIIKMIEKGEFYGIYRIIVRKCNKKNGSVKYRNT